MTSRSRQQRLQLDDITTRTCLSRRTLAREVADFVVTRAAVLADVRRRAVVDVDVTALSRPAVDADTLVVADRVDARRAVLTRPQRAAFVDVIRAKRACNSNVSTSFVQNGPETATCRRHSHRTDLKRRDGRTRGWTVAEHNSPLNYILPMVAGYRIMHIEFYCVVCTIVDTW